MPASEPIGLAARREAVSLLDAVLNQRRPLDQVLESKSLGELDSRDRAFAVAIVTTALRRLGQIEFALRGLMAKPLPRKSGRAREILLAAAAQVLFMRVPAHAAIDLAVSLARSDRDARHFSGLINAVLRRLSSGEHQAGPLILNTPDWLRERWRRAYGESNLLAIAEIHAEDPPLDLSCRETPGEWADRLGGVLLPTGTVRLSKAEGPVERLPGYAEGAWWVQDAAAALPARLLGDVRGRRVLDLCSAPGGKAAQLAAAGAAVTALDRSAERLERLKQNFARLRLQAEVVLADALEYSPPDPYDAVLLDAPCSATGTIRRNPDVAYLKGPDDIEGLAALQGRLLDKAAELVRPGGTLVYCTCSLEPEEGEDQARTFLARDSAFARAPIRPDEVSGLQHVINADGDLRTLPSFQIGPATGLDGFFATRFRRLA